MVAPVSRPTYSGVSQAGPRRFRIWTDRPPAAGASASRKGAGVAFCAALLGRTAMNSRSLAWAARCRRRRDSGRTWGSQQIRAPQLPFFRICSAAQSASTGFSGATQSN